MRQIIVMVFTRMFFAGLVAVVLAPCVNAQVILGGKPWRAQDQVNYSVLTSASQSRIFRQGAQLLVTEGDFQLFWAQATDQSPASAPRGVNWNREKVIAVSLGSRKSGGYSLLVQGLEKRAGITIVRAVERMPLPGQWIDSEPSAPFTLLKVDRSVSSVSLELTQSDSAPLAEGSIVITSPGTVIINPNNFDQPGGVSFMGDPAKEVAYSEFSNGDRCTIGSRGLTTLDSEGQYQAYWSRMTGQEAYLAPTGVRWWNERLVVVHLGTRNSGGYRLRVVRIEKNGLNAIIRAIEEKPVPGSFVSQSETSPYVILRVPRNINNFTLDLRSKEAAGGGVRVIGDGDGR